MRRSFTLSLAALLSATASAIASAQAPHAPEPPDPRAGLLPAQTIPLTDLRAFRPTAANWRVAGGASVDRARALALTGEAGSGVLVNSPTDAAKGHLLTTFEHGDLDLALDVMLPKGSNSGVYLMGRYEVQLFDSWGVPRPTFADMGGIYQRWNERRGPGNEGYEGVPPRLNASRAPGLWQHLEIVFRAPTFDGRRKIANARFVKVTLNGVVVQENVEVTGPTRAAPFDDERPTGPLMIQGDHGPIAVRNLQYKSYTGVARLSDLRYRAFTGERMDSAWIDTHTPVREGTATGLSSEPAQATNKFAVAFDGSLTVPTTGRYRFILNLDWVGAEPAMQGPAVAGARLSIDGNPVLVHRGAAQRAVADVDLTAGKHAFALGFFKNRQYGNQRDVNLWIEGPGVERQALHDESLLTTFGNPINPIILEAKTEPVLLRSFEWHRGVKRTTVLSVADPTGVHYSYDLAQGTPFYVWRGPFLETTQMWDGRGEDQISRPVGSVLDLAGAPTVAFLGDASAAWPDSITDERQLRRLGFQLDKAGRPTIRSQVRDVTVEDAIRPDSGGPWLRRELRLRAPASAETAGLHVLLAQGKRITRESDGSYAVDDKSYFITLPAGAPQPVVREQNGRAELLVPVRLDRGEATVAYSIVW
ncbi:MAG TPA: family 16 glycoside hydrolase [Gemmatimonadaceae bacterium]|nr:family 16 glycoside hydrolase [Gemmatimonadaceae bacterium]